MVLVPVLALGWLGHRLIDDQRSLANHEVETLLADRLREVDTSIARFVQERERKLLRVAEAMPHTSEAIRAHLKTHRVEALIVDKKGDVAFPPMSGPTSRAERELLDRTRSVWEHNTLPGEAHRGAAETPRREHGWHGFYHGSGLSLLLWVDLGDRIVAIELSRIVLLSELVAYLPATTTLRKDETTFRTLLSDASGDPVYQWGAYEPRATEPPQATVPLSSPLGAWSLRHFSPPSELPTALSSTLAFNLVAGLVALALALTAIAFGIYRVRTREMRLAAQRVSFVNQVSHELKTPLTNIRLYAELLGNQLGYDDDDEPDERDPVARHLKVITGESQRLSRLITNVLTFARGQEDRLEVRRSPGSVDAVIGQTRDTFEPALAQAGIALTVDLDADERVLVDADALGQILANLLSNVEKYAKSGGKVHIDSRRDGDKTRIVVADAGPGIPKGQRERVFAPFQRLSNALTATAAGTGIGLDIARRLARLHGGDLRLVDSEVGACFELVIDTPPPPTEGAAR